MTAPTFPRFAAAPKLPQSLLLDAPAPRSRVRAPVRWLEIATLAVLALMAGWNLLLSDRVATLERELELARIVGSAEAVHLMAADRLRAEAWR